MECSPVMSTGRSEHINIIYTYEYTYLYTYTFIYIHIYTQIYIHMYMNIGDGSIMKFINGGQSSNVYWAVGTSATSGTNAHFIGCLFLIVIDILLYLCLSGWSIWKYMVQIFNTLVCHLCM
jgi:hypothetical protein